MAAAFEVIEVIAQPGPGAGFISTSKTVAICKTAALAQTEYTNRGIAAYQAQVANPSPTLKAYTVRPIEIDLPGWV